MAMTEYVMTPGIRKRILNKRTLPKTPAIMWCPQTKKEEGVVATRTHPYSQNWNSWKYRQAELGEINCRTCGADLKAGAVVRSRTGGGGTAILRCKKCDIKVFGNGVEK